jgi:hypothetical protein
MIGTREFAQHERVEPIGSRQPAAFTKGPAARPCAPRN